MKVRIGEIIVSDKNRIRKENGDLIVLMKSMSKYGLLQPIIVDRNYNLLAGYRRYLCATKLGWSSIDVIIVDAKDKNTRLEIEIDENFARKEFTYDEIDSVYDIKEKIANPSIFSKIINFFMKFFFKK